MVEGMVEDAKLSLYSKRTLIEMIVDLLKTAKKYEGWVISRIQSFANIYSSRYRHIMFFLIENGFIQEKPLNGYPASAKTLHLTEKGKSWLRRAKPNVANMKSLLKEIEGTAGNEAQDP